MSYWKEKTYTPPGDENLNFVLPWLSLPRNNLHPARGRKREIWDCCERIGLETTYTPSGDENGNQNFCTMSYSLKQLTPRQGTKTSIVSAICQALFRNNLRPVRGRKLYCISEFFYAFARNNLRSARGRKKLLTHVDKEQKEIDTYETYFI